MNLLCDIVSFNRDNVCFLDTKRNMVIEGKFTKLVYSDFAVSLNGLYLYCPLQGQYTASYIEQVPKLTFQFSQIDSWNIHLMKELTKIEHEIIEFYKETFHIQKVNLYSLRNQLKTGTIKIVNTDREKTNLQRPITIKISGVWEKNYNVGITYKFQI